MPRLRGVSLIIFSLGNMDINYIILKASDIINVLIWFLVSLGVIYIVWNAVQFIRKAGTDDRAQYQSAILWGIVGLFIILSIWGLVNILRRTFNIGNAQNQIEAQQDINGLIVPVPVGTSPAGSGGGYNYDPGDTD